MSYDLVVFDARTVPLDREAFLAWYEGKLAGELARGDDGEETQDPVHCSPALRAWFMKMIVQYPPLGGPHAPDEVPDISHVTEYFCEPDMIRAGFRWSVARAAYKDVTALAGRHRVGLFDPSSVAAEVWIPDGAGRLRLLHAQREHGGIL